MIFNDPYIQEMIGQILNQSSFTMDNLPTQKNMAGTIQEQRKVLEAVKNKKLFPFILKLSTVENEIKVMNASKYKDKILKIYDAQKENKV
ncbi:hypothetical protein [Lactococcus lactis]